LFVFDGVTASAFRLDLPPEVSTFAQLTPVPQMSALLGLAANRVAGDAGIIQFDLEQGKARLLPTPEGFAAVQIVAVFPTTRKIVARGIRAGNTGAQYLIYDMMTGDLAMPPNPDGVAWVAQVPLQGPPQPGQMPVQPLQRPNPKANAIAAVTYGEDRRQNGVILIRVP
jgi:hypothetical protein